MNIYYEYLHTVGLEESNMVGNVYFVNPVRWQGRCRELFLRDHAPGVLASLRNGLSLVTVRCGCEYYAELFALDEISVRLYLGGVNLNRIVLKFEYWRINSHTKEHVGDGTQEIACMERFAADKLRPVAVPSELLDALQPYCTSLSRPVIAHTPAIARGGAA